MYKQNPDHDRARMIVNYLAHRRHRDADDPAVNEVMDEIISLWRRRKYKEIVEFDPIEQYIVMKKLGSNL